VRDPRELPDPPAGAEGRPAAVRVLHPAGRVTAHGDVPVAWARVAEEARVALEPDRGWEALARAAGPGAPWEEPERGRLPGDELGALLPHLQAATDAERIWFAVRDAHPELYADGAAEGLPRLRVGAVDHVVAAGPLGGAGALGCGPDLWWPDDGAWVVATGPDDHWTVVAGPASLVAALEEDPALETARGAGPA
jgi:hypothetical protein